MSESLPALPDGAYQVLARQVRALAAEPDSDRFLLGMATHHYAELAAFAAQARDVGGMSVLRDGAVATASLMAPAELDALDGRLQAAGAEPLRPAVSAYLEALGAIRRRGRVASEEEYGLVRDRFDRILRNPDYREEVEGWEALIAGWHDDRPVRGGGGPHTRVPAA